MAGTAADGTEALFCEAPQAGCKLPCQLHDGVHSAVLRIGTVHDQATHGPWQKKLSLARAALSCTCLAH